MRGLRVRVGTGAVCGWLDPASPMLATDPVFQVEVGALLDEELRKLKAENKAISWANSGMQAEISELRQKNSSLEERIGKLVEVVCKGDGHGDTRSWYQVRPTGPDTSYLHQ